MAGFEIWRRRQDSNLQARKGGGFQDRCITNYATSPQPSAMEKYNIVKFGELSVLGVFGEFGNSLVNGGVI